MKSSYTRTTHNKFREPRPAWERSLEPFAMDYAESYMLAS